MSLLLLLFFFSFIGSHVISTVYDGVDSLKFPLKRSVLEEFRYHQVVIPEIYSEETNLPITDLQIRQHNQILVKMFAFNKYMSVSLRLNEHLFGSRYSETAILGNSSRINNTDANPNATNCYYVGHVVGEALRSTAAISLCEGIRGYIATVNEGYHIEPVDMKLAGRHFVLRDSDYIGINYTCGVKDHSKPPWQMQRPQPSKTRRAVRWPYDANDKTMVIELYIANDFSQYKSLQRDMSEVIRRTKDIVNIVSSLYRPLNMYIALVGVEVWTENDKIEIVDNADATMNNFLDYRRNHICPIHPNDNAHLITGRTLGDGVVGKAPIMTICTFQYSGGVNLDHSPLVGPVATTLAHELGHNFGLTHDTEACGCPDDRCIMAPSSGGLKNPTKWSECSKQQFADSFHQGMDYCLHNLPDQLYPGSVCGNGFTEPGEECDCGLPHDCTNTCCNATTCKLQPNATCAVGECCDRTTCKAKPAATPCRPSRDTCDLAEYCSGSSELCPDDAYQQDGSFCQNEMSSSYCYKGRCNTHDAQCKLLWGSTGEVSHRRCFENFNVLGTVNGHCHFNWVDKSFKKCESSDVMCGMLHCQHRNEKLMFWKEALAFTLPEAWVLVNNTRYDCKAAILDVGLDMADPGMVPEGAKCAEGKLCIAHHCTPVSSLQVKQCPDCHSHGVCNNLGQCHCYAGYAPPYCDRSGTGGSEHSGPINVLHDNVGLVIGMCFLMFIVLTFVGILIVYIYQHNEKFKQFWHSRQNDKYRSVHHANPHNDAERPPAGVTPSPARYANGTVNTGIIYRPTPRTPARPRSVGARPDPHMSGDVKRTSSVRLQDISSPRLQSSTNNSIVHITRANTTAGTGPADSRLVPTRPAPAPPLGVHHLDQVNGGQPRKAPKHPPPPLSNSPNGRGQLKPGDHYEEIALSSPTGPPPAPPDSRHRFYSHQTRPASMAERMDGHVSVSNVKAKFEPVSGDSRAHHRQRSGPSSRPPPPTYTDVARANGDRSENGCGESHMALPPKPSQPPSSHGLGKQAAALPSRPSTRPTIVGSPRAGAIPVSKPTVNESQC